MWFHFYYTPELDLPVRQMQMSIYAPMREAIEWICKELGLRQADWTFAFNHGDLFGNGDCLFFWEEGDLHITPHEMGYEEDPNTEVLNFENIYCYPKVVNN